MTPYSGLYFFYIIFVLLIPAVILGLMGKKIKWYGFFVTLVMTFLIFGSSKKQMFCLTAFFLGELFLTQVYFFVRKKFKQRWILWIFIFCSLLPLILVKWGHILIHRNVGFLGVSYLTFKVIQVLIETYDDLIQYMNVFDFAYFILFFPTISSGPIDRSRRFMEDANKAFSRDEYIDNFKKGCYKLFKGVFFKFVLGMLVSVFWMSKIPKTGGFINTLNYMYAYSFYMYFDFAGYSFMAVGVSYILGILTPDNFNIPYLSRDIKDFWNRWHMSLSFWFRDFVYTRFVMAGLKHKILKNRYTVSYIGFMITMMTMGIWHGTEMHYIVYGMYHGILLCLTDFIERHWKFYKKSRNKFSFNLLSTIITFNLVCFGFLIFSGKLFK